MARRMTRVRLLRDGPIGRVILARPEKRNALDRRMADDLFAALAQFESDPACRVIHLGAAGEDFCSGADLAALDGVLDAESDVHRADAEAVGRVFLAIRALMKPVVCTVRGRALATGAGLASACDLILAHEGAEFGYPEVRNGFVPAMVMTMLRRAVGEKHAADLLLTGRIISAEEAERIGLVSRVVPAANFDDDINATLAQISLAPATSLALTKWLFYKLDSLSFEDGIAAGVVTNVEARATDDFKTGVKRFVHRRDKPL
jgi:methylglutaconyl-CoA hydratase